MDQKTKVFIANFHKFWGEDQKNKKDKNKGFLLKKCTNFHDFWGGTAKKKGLITKLAKKQFLLTNSAVPTSILRDSGLEQHSSGTEPVTFFRAQSSLGGKQFSFGRAQPRNVSPVAPGLVKSFFWSSPVDEKILYTKLL